MRDKLLITSILVTIGIGSSAVQGQQPAQTSPPPQPPKAAQKRPAPPSPAKPATTPHPYGPEVQAEPITVKLGHGGKVVISSRAGHIVLSGWDKDIVQATASSEAGPEAIETQTTGDAAHPRLMLIVPSGRRFGREI